ncbi:K(+)-transporting ATPase subunit F [Proteiniphilum sp.]
MILLLFIGIGLFIYMCYVLFNPEKF